jgi:hypothetical protein
MDQFVVTSTDFHGELLFKFDETGRLTGFDMENATLNPDQYEKLLSALPRSKVILDRWVKNSGKWTSTPVALDLSFETFYNTYAYKVGNKKKCEQLWNKMPDTEKTNALKAIPKYKAFSKEKSIDLVYPERYLSQQRYLNDFK